MRLEMRLSRSSGAYDDSWPRRPDLPLPGRGVESGLLGSFETYEIGRTPAELTSDRVVCLAGGRATLAAERAAGYSADMTVWQYAQLTVTHEGRLAASGNWRIA